MFFAYEPIWSQGVRDELDWDDKWATSRCEGSSGQARERCRHGEDEKMRQKNENRLSIARPVRNSTSAVGGGYQLERATLLL